MMQIRGRSRGASRRVMSFARILSGRPAKLSVMILAILVLLVTAAEPAWADETTSSTAGDSSTASLVLPAPEGYESVNPGVTLPEMNIQVWPEYDTADVLVLMDVFLPQTATFPYTFTYYVPKGARNTGIAEVDEAGEFVYDLTPQLTPGEKMDTMTLEIPKYNQLRLEYYYNPGVSATGTRSFPVEVWLPADVGNLSLSVQQPLRSTGFAVEPVLSQTSTDAQGFSYVQQSFSGAKAGQRVDANVTYTKEDSDPSWSEQDTGAGGDESAGGSNYFLLVVLAMVVGVLAVVGYQLVIRRNSAPASSSREGSTGNAGRPGQVRYCTECGAKLSKRDKFCSGCGAGRN